MKKKLSTAFLLCVMFLLFGCQDQSVMFDSVPAHIDKKLTTFPRFPEAVFSGISRPVLPVSNSDFAVLATTHSSAITLDGLSAQFEFAALELQLEFWSIPDERLVPFSGATSITTIGDEVYFFADQQIQSLEVTGELADYLLLSTRADQFSSDLIGLPVFTPSGQVLGLIHSFDIKDQRLRVLKFSVIKSFWSANQ